MNTNKQRLLSFSVPPDAYPRNVLSWELVMEKVKEHAHLLRQGKFNFILLVIIGLFACPNIVSADTVWYETYGDYLPILTAFKAISTIFADSSYTVLIATTAIMGIFMGILAVYAKMAMGGKGGLGAWAIPVGTGLVLYVGLVLKPPAMTVHVHDSVLNQGEDVPGIPMLVANTAYLLNKVEQTFINLAETIPIGTNTSPWQYGVQSAPGLELLSSFLSNGMSLDSYFEENLRSYITDCVYFELRRPGTNLSVNDFKQSDDLMTSFGKAATQGNYTTNYSIGNPPSPTSMTCFNAWSSIKTYLNNSSNFNNSITASCQRAGYSNVNFCTTNLQSVLSNIAPNGYTTAKDFTGAIAMTEILDKTISTDSSTAAVMLSNKSQMVSGLGAGIAIGSWMPAAKGAITGIVLVMIPFLLLFLPTPLVGKVTSLMFGLLLWITAWTCMDALVSAYGAFYAENVFYDVNTLKKGYEGIMLMPNAALKSLAMFGMLRGAGLTLATVFASMFLKFGGAAIAGMAGGMIGKMESAGGKAFHDAGTAEGQAKTHQEQAQAKIGVQHVNHYSWEQRTSARAYEMASQVEHANQTMAGLGMDAFGAASLMGQNASMKNIASAQSTQALIKNSGGQEKAQELMTGEATFNLTKSTTAAKEVAQNFGGSYTGAGVATGKGKANQETISALTYKSLTPEQVSALGSIGEGALMSDVAMINKMHDDFGATSASYKAAGGDKYAPAVFASMDALNKMGGGKFFDPSSVEDVGAFKEWASKNQGSVDSVKGLREGILKKQGVDLGGMQLKDYSVNSEGKALGLNATKLDGSMKVSSDGAQIHKTGVGEDGVVLDEIYGNDGKLVYGTSKKGQEQFVTMSAKEANDYANHLEQEPHGKERFGEFAKGLRNVASSGAPVLLNVTKTTDGEVVNVAGRSGAAISKDDFSNTRKGYENLHSAVNRTIIGTKIDNRNESYTGNVNDSQTVNNSGGTYNHGNLQPAVVNGNAGGIPNSIWNDRNEGSVFVEEMASTVAKIVTKQKTAQATMQGSAGGGVGFNSGSTLWGTGIKEATGLTLNANAGVETSKNAQDKDSVNVIRTSLQAKYDELQKTSISNTDKTKELVNFAHNMYESGVKQSNQGLAEAFVSPHGNYSSPPAAPTATTAVATQNQNWGTPKTSVTISNPPTANNVSNKGSNAGQGNGMDKKMPVSGNSQSRVKPQKKDDVTQANMRGK